MLSIDAELVSGRLLQTQGKILFLQEWVQMVECTYYYQKCFHESSSHLSQTLAKVAKKPSTEDKSMALEVFLIRTLA